MDLRYGGHPNPLRVELEHAPVAPEVKECPECGCTHGVHDIDCVILLQGATMLSHTEWGKGIIAINERLNPTEATVFRRVLFSGYTDLYQRESGSWGMIVDTHLDLTSAEAEVLNAIFNEEDDEPDGDSDA